MFSRSDIAARNFLRRRRAIRHDRTIVLAIRNGVVARAGLAEKLLQEFYRSPSQIGTRDRIEVFQADDVLLLVDAKLLLPPRLPEMEADWRDEPCPERARRAGPAGTRATL